MRRFAGDDVQQVLVIGGLSAARRRPRREGRVRRASPEPAAVEVTRATVIDTAPLGELEAADEWLARAVGDSRVTDAALALLNRAVAGHRVASADPWVADADPAHAIGFRVGYGTGEQVAEGDWESARELPRPEPAAARSALLVPQERVAALLGGRDAPLACEELVLRARGDLTHGRPREAALQLAVALEAALAELAAWREVGDMAARLDELAGLREAVEAAAQAALEGAVEPGAVEAPLARVEAALRARLAYEVAG
ncbi:MAG TPA: hypothetical protein VFP78_17885 [Solirubrobacteraceae bacterium]|nr:hypothetical protein [Solirubrobacteraceae bacterium]